MAKLKLSVRWSILLAVTAITAVASFYPSDDNSLLTTVSDHKRTPQPVATAEVNTVAGNAAEDGAQADDSSEDPDPFAPRGWKAPPPPPPEPPKPVAAAAVPAVPPAPAGPPPLPFKFVGAMNDDGAQIIYLSKGEQAYVAHDGETLDSTYKVLAVDGQHVEFEYLPTGDKQTLTIPASDN